MAPPNHSQENRAFIECVHETQVPDVRRGSVSLEHSHVKQTEVGILSHQGTVGF